MGVYICYVDKIILLSPYIVHPFTHAAQEARMKRLVDQLQNAENALVKMKKLLEAVQAADLDAVVKWNFSALQIQYQYSCHFPKVDTHLHLELQMKLHSVEVYS